MGIMESVRKYSTFGMYLVSLGTISYGTTERLALLMHYCFIHWLAGNKILARTQWKINNSTIDFDEMVNVWETKKNQTTKTPLVTEKLPFSTHYQKIKEISVEKSLASSIANEPVVQHELNLCELLRGQEGKEFWSPAFSKIELIAWTPDGLIFRTIKDKYAFVTTKLGVMHEYNSDAECIVFPSKYQRDWSKFNPCPFKDGELVWVKDSSHWEARYHSGKMTESRHMCYINQAKSGNTSGWKECKPFDQRPF